VAFAVKIQKHDALTELLLKCSPQRWQTSESVGNFFYIYKTI